MAVKLFELFHGIVLTKLVRNDKPMTLRLIETDVKESWSQYQINAEISLFVKHSYTPKERKRERASAWSFSFTPKDIEQIREANGKAFVALVCGAKTVNVKEMDVCLLTPDQIAQLLNLEDKKMQPILVKAPNRKQLRVSSSRVEKEILVPQNAFDEWEVPGS